MTVRKNGTGLIREGAKTKDNGNVSHKAYLRRLATAYLDKVRVLDLFAGKGILWDKVGYDDYVGVEIERDKSRRKGVIFGDNRRVIPQLDLSRFNVIDCDSYGVPATQIKLLYENKTLQKGTVIVYTCISNKVSTIPNTLQEYAGFAGDMYNKAQTLFNGWSVELFFDYLARLGVRRVWEYEELEHTTGGYTKKYGYFFVE